MTGTPLAAMIGFGGVLVGAMLSAWFTRLYEKHRFYRDNQRQAYSLFLSSLAGLAAYQDDAPEHREAKRGLIEARCQIALFGSPIAIRGLAAIFEKFADFRTPLAQAHLWELISTMRRDSGGKYEKGLKVELASLVVSTIETKPKE